MLFILGLMGLLAAIATAYYLLNRYAPRMETALQDSQLERFKRLEGLFHSIPREIRESPANRSTAAEFRVLAGELQALINFQGTFTSPLAPDLVHNLHLLYLQIAPVDFLSFEMIPLRQEFRDAVGPANFEAYSIAPVHEQQRCASDQEVLGRLLRADATFLANETRRQLLLKSHVESTRQKLVQGAFRSWWWNAVPLIAILIVYLFCQDAVDQVHHHPVPAAGAADQPAAAGKKKGEQTMAGFAQRYLVHPTAADAGAKPATLSQRYTTSFHVVVAGAMLSLIAMAGATGGMLSVIQRVQSVAGEANANADLRALSQCGTAVFFAPITGVLFALVISVMFAGQMVTGQMFPSVERNEIWYFTLWEPSEMPKWLLWGFIAGFSERLVPDMLNTFSKQALAQTSKGPAIAPAGADRVLAQTPGATDPSAAPRATDVPPLGVPVLHAPSDAIPVDATEITLSGEGLSSRSEVLVNGRPVPPDGVLEVTENSLRIRVEPADLVDADALEITVRNPPPGGGESEKLTIPIAVAIGG